MKTKKKENVPMKLKKRDIKSYIEREKKMIREGSIKMKTKKKAIYKHCTLLGINEKKMLQNQWFVKIKKKSPEQDQQREKQTKKKEKR